jgi:hypothetical protein
MRPEQTISTGAIMSRDNPAPWRQYTVVLSPHEAQLVQQLYGTGKLSELQQEDPDLPLGDAFRALVSMAIEVAWDVALRSSEPIEPPCVTRIRTRAGSRRGATP